MGYFGTLNGRKNYWKSSQQMFLNNEVFIFDIAVVNLDHFSVLILKLE
jgi:hypothetical protein